MSYRGQGRTSSSSMAGETLIALFLPWGPLVEVLTLGLGIQAPLVHSL